MRGELIDNLVIVTGPKAVGLNNKSFFGRVEGENLELSIVEATYLIDNDRLKIYKNDEKLTKEFFKSLLLNEGLYTRFLVYRDLRNRGYIVKTGFKYGSDFRLYGRGKSPGDGHSEYLVKIFHESEEISVLEFSSNVRVAHGVKKTLLMAVVDDEGDVTYYETEWTRP